MSSPQINQSGNTGATIGAGSALQFFNPIKMFVWLSWYSPIIIAFIVVFLSLIFQTVFEELHAHAHTGDLFSKSSITS